MKILIPVLGVLLIAGGAWWYMSQDSMDSMEDTMPEEVMSNENTDDNIAGGTQLAGTETPTTDSEGNPLVGGDAVVSVNTPGAVIFTVVGSNFEYDMKEIRVQEGGTVTINLRSVDGLHDWVVDEFDAATTQVQTNGEASVTFVADKKGSFEYYCSVGQHRANGMVGTLIVE